MNVNNADLLFLWNTQLYSVVAQDIFEKTLTRERGHLTPNKVGPKTFYKPKKHLFRIQILHMNWSGNGLDMVSMGNLVQLESNGAERGETNQRNEKSRTRPSLGKKSTKGGSRGLVQGGFKGIQFFLFLKSQYC